MRPALLFDIDGTLTETDTQHFEAMRETMAEQGVVIDWPTYKARMLGFANADIAAAFLPHLDVAAGRAVLADKEARFRARVANLTRARGLTEILQFALERRVPVAAVTNAPRANAELTLEALDLTTRFDAVIIGDELPRGKPDPLPYLEAMRLLGADPERCVVFEDSLTGVRAGVAAGVATIGVGESTEPAAMLAAGARITARDFSDPALLALVREKIGDQARSRPLRES